MVNAVLQGVRCADAQDSRIQVAKSSDMGFAGMKGLRFADVQELRFQAAKRLDMGNAVQQRGSIF